MGILCKLVAKSYLWMLSAFWSVLLAFAGVLFALWYENLGKPRLGIAPLDTKTDIVATDGRPTRFLSLVVRNRPRRAWLVRRQTAFSCHGKIVFLNRDGGVVAGPVNIRWDGKPECVKQEVVGNRVVPLFDPRLVRQGSYIDIPPDEQASLAIALRIAGASDAFGWSNESYGHRLWQLERLRLPPGHYTARVTVTSGDEVETRDFGLGNPKDDFDRFELDCNA